MAFEELFNPGVAHARDQQAAERLLPAPPPIAGAPPFEAPDLGIDIPSGFTDEPFPVAPKKAKGGPTRVDPPSHN